MMRDLIDFAVQRGTLLHPEAVRWLEAQGMPLAALQRALPAQDLPLVVTVDQLQRWWSSSEQGRAGAYATVSLVRPAPPEGARPPPPVLQPPAPPSGGRAVAPPRPAVAEAPLDGFGLHRRPGGPAPAPAPMALPLPLRPLPEVAQRAHGLPPGLGRPVLAPVEPLIAGTPASPEGKASGLLAPPVEVLKDITGQSTCTGSLSDFTRYFKDRLNVTRRLLKQRREMVGVVPIDRIPRNQQGVVRLIGLVSDVRTTKNGYRIIELEDETGTIPLLVPKDDHRHMDLGREAERIMKDEVLGVHAKVVQGRDILYLEDMFRPDVEHFEPRRAREPALACFISDVHFGAKTFLEGYWDTFVRWLQGKHGSPEERALAQRVQYLVVAGDMVDGVGVYPNQDLELAIPDVEGQYAFAARQFARIPDRIRVVMLPGNHDAVRPAEPQPAMGERFRKGYPANVTFVGNPCQVSLMGVEVLAYHGVSLIDYVTTLRGLNVQHPVAIMEEVLKRRHLAPMYGGATPFAPEARDYLVVDKVPDIFVTGHLHTCDMGSYKNVTLINAGTWQAQTSYQKMLGIEPEPARVPYVDLSTGKGGILRFDRAAA